MKIVAVEISPSKQRGGSEKAFFEVLVSLKKLGHEILLAYCQLGDLIPDYEGAGIQTFFIPSTNIQNWFSITSFIRLSKSALSINAYKPDLIYINYLSDTPLAALLKLFYGIPSVCHIRVPYMGSSRQFSFCAQYANAFIVLNQKMKYEYELKEHLKNVYVVNDSISIPHQTFTQEKKNAAIYLGRISPEKGIIELIKVWLILKEKYNINYPLDIIGPAYSEQEKKYFKEVSEAIACYKLNHIQLLPAVNNPMETLSEYHFAILPSHFESFGRVIPEAILANTPIFARNIGITAEILKPQKESLIFDSESDLAQKIFLFLKKEIRVEMGDLKKHIIDNYSIDKNIKSIEQIMLHIIN